LLVSEQIPKEDLDYILEPFGEQEEPDIKIVLEKIKVIVRDAKGNIVDKREQRMKSLTQYFLAFMSIPILSTYPDSSSSNANSILTNILGLPSQQYSRISNVYNNSYINFDMSIQLGSGTQAFSPTLNSLAAPIINGSGTGQLLYNTLSFTYSQTSITAQLIATNSTSSAISVSEIGLQGIIRIGYVNGDDNYAIDTYTFLLSYDTFSTSVSIPAGGNATFQITVNFTG
jgi:hypothetical protein